MRRLIVFIAVPLLMLGSLQATQGALLISEVACGTTGDDWVELRLTDETGTELNIAPLFVTMYYGANEALSTQPVTLYSHDRPETPYDDRYAVVHLTRPALADETDLTGDTNHNGSIDVYCANYAASLWNSDGVAAIDTDDDPANGGVLDFVAYSNRDGSVNSTIESYVNDAQHSQEWEGYSGENIQECMIDIGAEGLPPHKSIARAGLVDTNTMEDFRITNFQTPGRENVLGEGPAGKGRLFSIKKRTITIVPGHPVLGAGDIQVAVVETCNMRFRLFNPLGFIVHESPLYRDLCPGNLTLTWDCKFNGKRACSGLYLGLVEATCTSRKRTQEEHIYIILSRYK